MYCIAVSEDDLKAAQSSLVDSGYGSQEAAVGGRGVLLHCV